MKKKTIFIIDDDYSNRVILEASLASKKYSIKSFPNVMYCVEELEHNKPDLFIIDLLMPVKDGFWLLDFIDSCSELKDIPRIVLSGVRNVPLIKKANSFGIGITP